MRKKRMQDNQQTYSKQPVKQGDSARVLAYKFITELPAVLGDKLGKVACVRLMSNPIDAL